MRRRILVPLAALLIVLAGSACEMPTEAEMKALDCLGVALLGAPLPDDCK